MTSLTLRDLSQIIVTLWGWKDDAVVVSAYCSTGGLKFRFQPSCWVALPVPGDTVQSAANTRQAQMLICIDKNQNLEIKKIVTLGLYPQHF